MSRKHNKPEASIDTPIVSPVVDDTIPVLPIETPDEIPEFPHEEPDSSDLRKFDKFR